MKGLLVVLMMLCPVVALGQTKAVTKDFPLTVHVISSRIHVLPSGAVIGAGYLDLLHVTIKGRKYVLAAEITKGWSIPSWPFWLIEPGDYPAQLKEDKTLYPGEIERKYKLRLTNGKTVDAFLFGMSE
jgi:hypothetical protein